MSFDAVRPDVVKYEMRTVGGTNINEHQQKKPGFFGRILSGMGKMLGAVATPLSFIFPPAAIGAAGMYALGYTGDVIQKNAYEKMATQQNSASQNLVTPGFDMGVLGGSKSMGGGSMQGSPNVSQQTNSVLDVLYSRNGAMLDTVKKFEG